jgi:predicted urease superfamily metal-dependent hydrolase
LPPKKNNFMPLFFDTHAHLDYPDYAPDFAEVLARAQAAGITKIISIGTSLDSSRRAVALAERHPAIYAAVGWHPSEALSAPADLRPALRELARHPKVVAIGETGLDYFRLPSMSGAHGVTRPTSSASGGSGKGEGGTARGMAWHQFAPGCCGWSRRRDTAALRNPSLQEGIEDEKEPSRSSGPERLC